MHILKNPGATETVDPDPLQPRYRHGVGRHYAGTTAPGDAVEGAMSACRGGRVRWQGRLPGPVQTAPADACWHHRSERDGPNFRLEAGPQRITAGIGTIPNFRP